jgi:hypothetical protein
MSQFRMVNGVMGACIAALAVVGPVSMAQAACLGPQQQLPANDVAPFLSNPGALLEDPAYSSGGVRLLEDPAYSSGGVRMISRIRDLAASDPGTLNVLIDLIAKANPDQQTAIGTGLAQAALVCVKTDQAYATQIQQDMAGYPDKDNKAVFAFMAVLADAPIGALGGGEGVSGGAGGGELTPFTSSLFASSAYVPWGPYGQKTIGFSSTFLSGPIGNAIPGNPPPGNRVTSSVSPHR